MTGVAVNKTKKLGAVWYTGSGHFVIQLLFNYFSGVASPTCLALSKLVGSPIFVLRLQVTILSRNCQIRK